MNRLKDKDVIKALKKTKGHLKQAADILGCTEGAVAYRKRQLDLVKLGIDDQAKTIYRPTQYTDEQITDALMQSNDNNVQAAKLLGCAPSTVLMRKSQMNSGYTRPVAPMSTGVHRKRKYSNTRISNALKKTNGYIRGAAERLGCDMRTIKKRLDEVTHSPKVTNTKYSNDTIISALQASKGDIDVATQIVGCDPRTIPRRFDTLFSL